MSISSLVGRQPVQNIVSALAGRRLLVSFAVLGAITFVLLAATIGGSFAMHSFATEQSREEIEKAVDTTMDSITLQVQASIAGVVAIRLLFDASETVTRSEFKIFTSTFLDQIGGIQALEWIPRIPADGREAFEADLRSRFGISDASIHPQTRSVEYFPVGLVEPLAGNEAAVGFDLASNPTRLAALIEARDTGRPIATEHITLVPETGTQLGFLVFVPAYVDGGVPASLDRRRELLSGFALGVFRYGDFLE